jgi:hypothetical protein
LNYVIARFPFRINIVRTKCLSQESLVLFRYPVWMIPGVADAVSNWLRMNCLGDFIFSPL